MARSRLTHWATLAKALPADTVYMATVSGLRDLYGNVLDAPYTWEFATPANRPFIVEATSPPPGAVAVPLIATLVVTRFANEGLLPGSEAGAWLELRPAASSGPAGRVTGELAIDGRRLARPADPDEPLQAGTVYQPPVPGAWRSGIMLVGATSRLGQRQVAPYHWMRGRKTYDPLPPAVTRTEPDKNATGVPLHAAGGPHRRRQQRI